MVSVDESPQTRVSLLVQLREGTNQSAWNEFLHLYGPVVFGFARRRGLQDADAADILQDVLRSVAASIGLLDYDRERGTFRGWLFTMTRNKIYNFLSARRIRPQAAADTATYQVLETQTDADEGLSTWEQEYQRQLAALAMERIRGEFQESTWMAFQQTTVEGLPVAEVADRLGLTAGAVYVAKSRVLARLKREVEQLRLQEEASHVA